MARTFTPPKVNTKGEIGPVTLAYAFQLKARFDPAHRETTPHGQRVFQSITGGTITGPGLTGAVFPDSGGNFGAVRSDGVDQLYARFMVKAGNGEWLYFSHVGYHRPDGYFRIQAYFDADVQGPHAWLNDAVLIGSAEASQDGRDVTFTYYQAL
jgi:hypothetical protein